MAAVDVNRMRLNVTIYNDTAATEAWSLKDYLL